jgi:hypothetical protein
MGTTTSRRGTGQAPRSDELERLDSDFRRNDGRYVGATDMIGGAVGREKSGAGKRGWWDMTQDTPPRPHRAGGWGRPHPPAPLRPPPPPPPQYIRPPTHMRGGTASVAVFASVTQFATFAASYPGTYWNLPSATGLLAPGPA